MNTNILKYYRQFRKHSPFMLVGSNAQLALQAARTLAEWDELQSTGKVRIRQEIEEEGYFDVFGEPDTDKERERVIHQIELYGCYWVVTEYLDHGDYEQADSIGMCVYNDCCDPFKNAYLIEMMQSAIDQYKCNAYPVCP